MAEAETTRSSIDSNIDLAIDAINVVTGRDIGVSTGSDAYPGEGPASDRPLFDFERLLRGGPLDGVFGTLQIAREAMKSGGGLINVTVRVIPRSGDDKLGRNPRDAAIELASPFVAAMGEDAHFGTFTQVSAILHSSRPHREIHSILYHCLHTASRFTLHPILEP